jgi:hypothetical protein
LNLHDTLSSDEVELNKRFGEIATLERLLSTLGVATSIECI